MIDILDPIAEAQCDNCGGKITKYHGSITAPAWSHETTHTAYCPGAPQAYPAPGTITALTGAGTTRDAQGRAASGEGS